MSREKQVEEMANDYYEIMLKAAKSFGTMSQGVSKFYARHLYEKGYRKQAWISVKDGLPETNRDCLLLLDTNEIVIGYCRRDLHAFVEGGIVLVKDVTHWMPLPEAPKMKGGAENG